MQAAITPALHMGPSGKQEVHQNQLEAEKETGNFTHSGHSMCLRNEAHHSQRHPQIPIKKAWKSQWCSGSNSGVFENSAYTCIHGTGIPLIGQVWDQSTVQ